MQDYYEPKAGDLAPNFRLQSTRGKNVTLEEFRGKDVILYFYPKDDTPGCTAEACSFRDHESDLTKNGAVVLGVSTDSIESHEKFRDKHQLNFPLLSDATADIAKMYGVWKEKNLYGRRSWGVARTTFWIGADGRIRKIYKKVDTAKHAEDILADMKAAREKK
ncbi:MAG TPA: thioredoxin-dependent thiol peroxidase [Thermoanaerobaculia bacterium]|nr:thioredoxin-dependent thiol peroxidase [Thermoanaerobaculia bacterium]